MIGYDVRQGTVPHPLPCLATPRLTAPGYGPHEPAFVRRFESPSCRAKPLDVIVFHSRRPTAILRKTTLEYFPPLTGSSRDLSNCGSRGRHGQVGCATTL
jgi:hypothetical protein